MLKILNPRFKHLLSSLDTSWVGSKASHDSWTIIVCNKKHLFMLNQSEKYSSNAMVLVQTKVLNFNNCKMQSPNLVIYHKDGRLHPT